MTAGNTACALARAARIKRLPLRLQPGQQDYVAAPVEPASQPASQGGGAAGELGLALPPSLLQLTPAPMLQPLPGQDLLPWMPASSALQSASHGGSTVGLQPAAAVAPVALSQQRQAARAPKVNDVPRAANCANWGGAFAAISACGGEGSYAAAGRAN